VRNNSPNREEEYEKVKAIDEMAQDVTSERESQEFISGKQGAPYVKHCAFSIQPQNYPNAINYVSEDTRHCRIMLHIALIHKLIFFQSHFPCSILRPGEIYCHDLIYKFGIQLANYM